MPPPPPPPPPLLNKLRPGAVCLFHHPSRFPPRGLEVSTPLSTCISCILLALPLHPRAQTETSSTTTMAARCPYFAAEESTAVIRPGESPAAALRRILATPGAHQAPGCFDALSARLVERAGFQIAFMSGFCVSATRLGLPDVGLISYEEMVSQGRLINESVSIPVVGDGDNGYGNSMAIKRTIKGYINAGFAGIMLEDQVSPKACGHTGRTKVISREEAIMHVKAAVDARNESGSDLVIVARTDSRQCISFDEALWRVKAFADVGADVLLMDAIGSVEEMKAFCAVAPGVPKMVNMIEGGKTPILSPAELGKIGYSLVIYSVSLLGVSMRAMKDALVALNDGGVPPPSIMPSFAEVKETLGFNRYYHVLSCSLLITCEFFIGRVKDVYITTPVPKINMNLP